MMRGLAPLVLIALLASCARQELPPGTRPDEAPPRPVELIPEYGDRVPGFDGSARVRFDEPLANPRNLGRDIVGSPAGRYETSPARNGVDVRPEDGWREGVVYYIRLPAGLSDLLRNQTLAPVEWLFSTGDEVPPDTEVTGRAIDRVTARGERGLRLLFLSSDSVPYTIVSDTSGVFRLPGLPPGDYEAIAFEDQNRDFAYDPEFEPGGTSSFAIGPDSPTAELELIVLPADTTAPVLAGASAVDSLTLRLEFDDPLDPEADLAAARVTVRDTASGAEVPVAEFQVGAATPEPDPEEVEEPAEDEAPEAEPEPDPEIEPEVEPEIDPDVEPGLEPELGPEAQPDEAALEPPDLEPAADFVTVRLAEPLAPGAYEVEIQGVVNLRELAGGGSATFTYEPPPEPEAELEDEAEVEGEPETEDGDERPAPEPSPEPEGDDAEEPAA